jgi:2-polyprenyl-6-methoxyphenol hydroxylase-like FAD-dependent oxidoreductase
VTVVFNDGSSQRFDLLVGADGYRSVIRQQVMPDTRPQYAGYILWRGNYPESRLRHRAAIHRGTEAGAWYYICLAGGHGIVYMIPDFDRPRRPRTPPSELGDLRPTASRAGLLRADVDPTR